MPQQLELHSDRWHELPDASLLLVRAFYPGESATALYRTLHKQIDWEQPQIKLFGKVHKVPRLTAFCGDSDVRYSYSGVVHRAKGWPKVLAGIRQDIEARTGHSFNSVLANYYRDGEDANGWHADDERELGVAPVIASLSLGVARDFQFRHKHLKQHNYCCELPGGSLLLMAGNMQAHWLHQLPRRKRIAGGRINLTFRQVKET